MRSTIPTLFVAAILAIGGCSSIDDETSSPESAADQPDSSVQSDIDEAGSNSLGADSEDPDDVAFLCDSYLENLAGGDTDGLAVAFGSDAPAGVTAAIETLKAEDSDIELVWEAQADLADYVEPVCAQRWSRGVTGASDTVQAAETFFGAIVAGDPEAASELAPDNVVALFEPWEPIVSDDPGLPQLTFSEAENSITMVLDPEASAFCSVADGVITSCDVTE